MTSLESTAQTWDQYAQSLETRASYEATFIGDVTAIRNQAKAARDAAKALRLQAETGKTHCVCCLIPIEQCYRRNRKA